MAKKYTKDASKALSLPEGYVVWRKGIIALIEQAKYKAVMSVNSKLLSLYWKIGTDIIKKQKEKGWGTRVIEQLAKDLTFRFPDDKGYSVRNLKYMRQFAANYPDFPIVQVPLAQITWYHHISLIPRVKNIAQRAALLCSC